MSVYRGLGVVVLIALLIPAGARAHAYLVKAVPAQRAVVFAAPSRVQLYFNERLEPKFCTLSVLDAKGNAVHAGDAIVGAEDPKQLAVGLKPLGSGVYTVRFRVLSVDGHVVADQYIFTVRERR